MRYRRGDGPVISDRFVLFRMCHETLRPYGEIARETGNYPGRVKNYALGKTSPYMYRTKRGTMKGEWFIALWPLDEPWYRIVNGKRMGRER